MNVIGEQGSLYFRVSSTHEWEYALKILWQAHFQGRGQAHDKKKNQLPKSDSFNKWGCFCEAVDGSIWYPVDTSDV